MSNSTNKMTNELKEAFKKDLDTKGLLYALINLMKADSKLAGEIHMAAQPYKQTSDELSNPLQRIEDAISDMPVEQESFAFVVAKQDGATMAMIKGNIPEIAVTIAKTMDREQRIKDLIRMSHTANKVANELGDILGSNPSPSGNPLEDLFGSSNNPFSDVLKGRSGGSMFGDIFKNGRNPFS